MIPPSTYSAAICLCVVLISTAIAEPPVEIGSRRELMVDQHLIERLSGVRLEKQEPRDEGIALQFDRPWEGAFCGYCTVIRDGDAYRVYYRGKPKATGDGSDEVTCVAESQDGVHWTKPRVGRFAAGESRDNNIVLGDDSAASHNFSPLVDTNPAASAENRFKALGGTMEAGIFAFVSSDGINWEKLRDQPILTREHVKATMPDVGYMFDSQNLAFWSEAERKYVMFFRVFKDNIRRIARAESQDFLAWTNLQLMEYRTSDGSPPPVEQLYTSQTHPYFRAPHLYVATAARFMPGRQVLNADEAKAINVNPTYFKDTSDAILMTTRGGAIFDRTFLGAFLRPGIGARNWVSRTNYPALNIVQTSPTEMSFYVNQDYAQPTAHLHRYSLRLDGFASVRAPYAGGELLTKPLIFQGDRLLLNFATSAAGGIRIEIQDAAGTPIPGYRLEDAVELIGNEIERSPRWKAGADVRALAGRPVRLRFVMKDADLYAFRFGVDVKLPK